MLDPLHSAPKFANKAKVYPSTINMILHFQRQLWYLAVVGQWPAPLGLSSNGGSAPSATKREFNWRAKALRMIFIIVMTLIIKKILLINQGGPNMAKYAKNAYLGAPNMAYEVSLKRSCKMLFGCVGLWSIGPSSQKLWPNHFSPDRFIVITL